MSEDVFRWVITLGVFLALVAFVVQAVVFFAMYRVTKATQDKLMPMAEALTPILGTVRRFLDENSPKFSQMTSDAAQVVATLQEHVERLGEVVKEMSDRARAQVARIDGAMDLTVEQVQQASDAVKTAILKPVKQVDGIMHGIRAALSVVAHSRRESVDHATQDEEMFI
jgi:ABC-type transporter Mla subunit MlaD